MNKAKNIENYLLTTTLNFDEISKKCNCSYSYVSYTYRMLMRNGQINSNHIRKHKNAINNITHRNEIVNYLVEHPGITLQEIGNNFGISRERVRQILKIENKNIKDFRIKNIKNEKRILEFLENNKYEFATAKDIINQYNKTFSDENKLTYNILSNYNWKDYIKRGPKENTKTNKIVDLLKDNTLLIKDIAKECNVYPTYVCVVNKRYNVRRK